jgi:hypothetical protein
VTGVAGDSANNTIVSGWFINNIDLGNGAKTSTGGADIFIAKYSPQNTLLWARTMGEGRDDFAYAVAVDSQGNVIVTGSFDSLGPVDFGGTALSSIGGMDIFVAKYSSSGTLLWAKRFGGSVGDIGYGLAVDTHINPSTGRPYDDVVLAAQFSGAVDFGTGPISGPAFENMGLVRLRSTDGAGLWAKVRGTSGETPAAVAVDAFGDVLVTGNATGPSDFGGGTIGSGGIFLAKYAGVDGSYRWARSMGGYSGYALATDASGKVVLTGDCAGSANFGGGSITSSGSQPFLAGYDASGNYLWARVISASNGGSGRGVAIDSNGIIAVTGSASGTMDFGFGVTSGSTGDFVATYNTSGTSAPMLRWVRTPGATGGGRVAFDSAGHLIATGQFRGSVDFGGVAVSTPIGATDGFVAQYLK